MGELFQLVPDQIKDFFNPSFSVTPLTLIAVDRRIATVRDERLRALLTRYTRYVLRYDVVLVLTKNNLFQARGLGFRGDTYHVAVRNGQIEPIVDSIPWEEDAQGPPMTGQIITGLPMSDRFESEVPVPSGLQSLLDKGLAKYLLIEDKDASSLLRQILNFTSPNQVAVIDCEFTKLFFVGENVPLIDVWPDLRKVVADSQRQNGNSDQRGRSPKLWRIHGYLSQIVRGNGSMEDKAQILLRIEDREAKDKGRAQKPQTAERVASKASYLSQLKGRLKDRTV